eukprot:gene31243-6410_t
MLPESISGETGRRSAAAPTPPTPALFTTAAPPGGATRTERWLRHPATGHTLLNVASYSTWTLLNKRLFTAAPGA